jgi:hypothetical protein
MKTLSFAVILLFVGLALVGCQDDQKKSAGLWNQPAAPMIANTSTQPSFRNEFRFLENEQLYYGMEAERSRMAQAKAGGKLYSSNTTQVVVVQNSY